MLKNKVLIGPPKVYMYLKVSEARTDAFIFFQLIDFLGKVAWRLQGDKESKSCTNLNIL